MAITTIGSYLTTLDEFIAHWDDASEETVVDSFPEGVESAETDAGLAAPGDTASFKVYVVRDTGSAAGSNTVTISRPAEA